MATASTLSFGSGQAVLTDGWAVDVRRVHLLNNVGFLRMDLDGLLQTSD